jgi:hypothetical protein
MKLSRLRLIALVVVFVALPALHAIEKQSSSAYRARRVALAAKLHGGVAVLFAAEEPTLDFDPYRQDEDFYYLTGWNEPGAALLIVARRFCFCPRATCASKNTQGKSWTQPRPARRRPPAWTRCSH